MNVPDQLRQIRVALAKYRLIPSLQNMADVPVSTIVVLGVAGQKPVHYSPDVVSSPLYQQMNMIRHQTVCIKIEWHPLLLPREHCQKSLMVLRRMEDILAINASCDDVIKPALNLKPRFPGHLMNILYHYVENRQYRRPDAMKLIPSCRVLVNSSSLTEEQTDGINYDSIHWG